MGKFISISVPEPCHENWDGMTPKDKGRYCGSCEKTVIDFSLMSDAEMASYLNNLKTTSTCGRFAIDQLNRAVVVPRKPWPFVKYFFKITLPAFLLSLKNSASAQSLPSADSNNIVVTTVGGFSYQRMPVTTPIKGRVTDENGTPLPGASIIIEHNKGTATDEDGKFTIKKMRIGSKITISYIGFVTREIIIDRSQAERETFVLERKPSEGLQGFLGGAVVVVTRRKARKVAAPAEAKQSVAVTAISTFPNPVTGSGELNVRCASLPAGKYTAQIFSLNGELVRSSEEVIQKATSQITLRLQNLFSGSYVLRLTNVETHKGYSTQVLVRN